MSLSCFRWEMLDLGTAGVGFFTSGAMKWKLRTLYHLTLVVEVLKSAMESWAEPRQSSLLLTSLAQMLTCNVLATSLFLEIAIGKFSPKVGLDRSLMARVQNVQITLARAGNKAALIELKTNKQSTLEISGRETTYILRPSGMNSAERLRALSIPT